MFMDIKAWGLQVKQAPQSLRNISPEQMIQSSARWINLLTMDNFKCCAAAMATVLYGDYVLSFDVPFCETVSN